MIGVTLKAAKTTFFDANAILKKVPNAERRALSKAGAFVRQRARTSMRKRKGASPPGKPPHAHAGLIRDFLFFTYDPSLRTVIVGPILLSGRGMGQAQWLAEHGGTVARERRRGMGGMLKRYAANYPARPFMLPALLAEAPKFARLWKDQIR